VDVAVANVGSRNELYLNDGSGLSWTKVPIGERADVTYGVAAGDLDGDGYTDLGFAN
ncbi:MAG: VCBS repeat-containing protein, partial [Actinobacteria bacterium]|nr:VCBS repeat-containing protein [Actinomycetota bacterium]NIU63921.1 VCBS repeat-containing protein [Actinomycetota bacterium]NIW25718.1 VCBS repeat-containing protein [Actinomycetota bacterium]